MSADITRATWLRSLDQIRSVTAEVGEWRDMLGVSGSDLPPCGLHLAVFIEPFLSYILDGTKTLEARFSLTRCAPFGKVRRGDIILIKRAGGPVVGIARISSVASYNLDPSSWRWIREEFSVALRAQSPGFWEKRAIPSYATLMTIDRVLAIEPIEWKKRDRRGWVIIQDQRQPFLFRDHDDA